MQSKKELEKWWETPDAWGYKTTEDDLIRRAKIAQAAFNAINGNSYHMNGYERCLDIGAGEGFITEAMPAFTLHGFEISDNAAARFPSNVKRVVEERIKSDYYDLVLLTGVLYKQYDHKQMADLALRALAPKGVIVTCNIKSWEIEHFPRENMVHEEEFDYRKFKERLAVYKGLK